MRAKWKSIVALGMIFSILGMGAWAEDEEAALRGRLAQMTGQESGEYFYYGDYNGDGVGEAFAVVNVDDSDGLISGDIWYVDAQSGYALQTGRTYCMLGKCGQVAPMYFRAEENYGGSGSVSYIWGVGDGKAYELDVAGMENFSYDEESGSFCVYATYFDDYMGHCWIKYYYYADESGLKEYGAISISQEELLEFKGAAAILTEAANQGGTVREILYRANGIINVNLRVDGHDEILNLKYQGNEITQIGKDYGICQAAYTPECATYPVEFVHPEGGAAVEDAAWRTTSAQMRAQRLEFFQNSQEISGDFAIALGEDRVYVIAYGGTQAEVRLPEMYFAYGQANLITAVLSEGMAGCEEMQTLVIPEGYTFIGANAFYGCENLTTVVLPESITEIQDGAFAHCPKLTQINLPNNLQSMGEGVFEGCDALAIQEGQEALSQEPSTQEAPRQELSGCLGMDIQQAVEIGDLSPLEGYRMAYGNGAISLLSFHDGEPYYVEAIYLNQPGNYSLLGLSVGMEYEAARQRLLDQGYRSEDWGFQEFFYQTGGYTLTLTGDSAGQVASVSLGVDQSVQQGWYQ